MEKTTISGIDQFAAFVAVALAFVASLVLICSIPAWLSRMTPWPKAKASFARVQRALETILMPMAFMTILVVVLSPVAAAVDHVVPLWTYPDGRRPSPREGVGLSDMLKACVKLFKSLGLDEFWSQVWAVVSTVATTVA